MEIPYELISYYKLIGYWFLKPKDDAKSGPDQIHNLKLKNLLENSLKK